MCTLRGAINDYHPARMVIIHSPSNVRRGCSGAGAHRDMHGASLVGRPVMDEHASEAGAQHAGSHKPDSFCNLLHTALRSQWADHFTQCIALPGERSVSEFIREWMHCIASRRMHRTHAGGCGPRKRARITRGALLGSASADALQLEIGIVGACDAAGDEVLEVCRVCFASCWLCYQLCRSSLPTRD